MDITLTNHSKQYGLNFSETVKAILFLGSGYEFALRHFEMAVESETGAELSGHLLLGAIEILPFVGLAIGIVERIVVATYRILFPQPALVIPPSLPIGVARNASEPGIKGRKYFYPSKIAPFGFTAPHACAHPPALIPPAAIPAVASTEPLVRNFPATIPTYAYKKATLPATLSPALLEKIAIVEKAWTKLIDANFMCNIYPRDLPVQASAQSDKTKTEITQFFIKTIHRLKKGEDAPLPEFFHATGRPQPILDTQMLKPANAVMGYGSYVSNNDESYAGFGTHTFAVGKESIMSHEAHYHVGRQKHQHEAMDSLWIGVNAEILINHKTVAFMINRLPYYPLKAGKIRVVSENAGRVITSAFDQIRLQTPAPAAPLNWRQRRPEFTFPTVFNGL